MVWAFGIGIFMAASKTGNVGMVLGGRFLAGVGIGKYSYSRAIHISLTIVPKARQRWLLQHVE